jgi:tetratricopeptide (TPR) repeat protein
MIRPMSQQRIYPERIGTPFQLLAAALVFVVLLDGTLLSAAAVLEGVPAASILLVIAAILYPPLLLGGVFVLQTKYREKLLGDDAFLQLADKVKDLRSTVDASGFDVTRIPGAAPAAGLSSAEESEIQNRVRELERSIEASLREDEGQLKVVAEASRELGHAALAQGRWREAAEHLAEYLAVNPRDWREWFAQGTAYSNTREGPETDALAVLAYTRALETLPSDVDRSTRARLYTYRAGVLKRDPKQHAQAESGLATAQEYAEEGSYEADDVHYNMAALLSMRGETDAAIRELLEIADPWYFEAVIAHTSDYFANLAERADFDRLLDEKLPGRNADAAK